MPKILHLIHSFERGGIEKWLLSMLQQVPRQQWAMDVCCKGFDTGPLADAAKATQANIYLCPLSPTHWRFARQLKRLLHDGEYDLLHVHLETYSGFPTWIAQQLGIPVITSFHNVQFQPQTRLTRLPIVRQLRSVYAVPSINYALQHSQLVTGCSSGVLKHIDPTGQKLGDRGQILSYGVQLTDPATDEAREAFRTSYGWSRDTPIVLHIGRLIEQKNHPGLLAIFQQVRQQIPQAKLLLVGDGPLREQITQTINDDQLHDAVKLLGMRDDVPMLMSQSDVLLFPSLYEGFGLVAIEASGAQLPIVASRVPGLTESVRDGETGLLHELDDINGMAHSVITILNNPTYANILGKTGRDWVEQQFTPAASAQRLLKLYEQVLSQSSACTVFAAAS